MGKGGREHVYLQNLMKKLAEERGWRTVIEEPVWDGAGRVDVSLERAKQKVACEVSVASSVEQELANIQKCLAPGYEQVVVLAKDRRFLGKLGDAVRSELEEDSKVRVLFLEPEELVAWLEEEDAAAAGEGKTVRGYRVKVRYSPLAEQDKDTKKQAIFRVVLDSLKRLQKGSSPGSGITSTHLPPDGGKEIPNARVPIPKQVHAQRSESSHAASEHDPLNPPPLASEYESPIWLRIALPQHRWDFDLGSWCLPRSGSGPGVLLKFL